MSINHYHEDRPWGSFERFVNNAKATVKILDVRANKRLSLQKHAHRSESWHVISGSGIITIGTEELNAKQDDEFEIPTGIVHRITGGEKGIRILEIATGDFDEDDITRIEDDFNRTSNS